MQWSIGILSLISNVWHSLTLEKYIISGPLVQLVLSKTQSKVNGQTINYCIPISIKKVAQSSNSFLKHGINILPIFYHAYSKHLEVNFTCPEFVSTFEKSVYSFYLFFRYSQCWSPVSRVLKPTWPYPPKSFSINFQF